LAFIEYLETQQQLPLSQRQQIEARTPTIYRFVSKSFSCKLILSISFVIQDPRWNDVNVISSLLKSFFRKLPDSLFTSELYPHFVLADKIDEPTRRLREIRKLVRRFKNLATFKNINIIVLGA
jgi:RhoGAP domain